MTKETLLKILDENRVPAEKQKPLLEALDAMNAVPGLAEKTREAARNAVEGLVTCEGWELEQPRPESLSGFAREAYAFLFTQICAQEGRKALRARGIPETYDRDIPERMTRKQLKKYAETGDISFDDFQWDMNFYCCQIFFLNRFYFIPYRWGDTPTAWRNRETGEVTALWRAGDRIRRDGQLDGVNGVTDPEAFTTVYEETETEVRGNRVLPEGLISPEIAVLDKRTWYKALGEDNYLLALHIPGGEGYTPERVRQSCEEAMAFFGKYYPEYDYKGIWSESWLFDPGLREILSPDRNIVRVQKQFYCYPTEEGDRMIRLEVLGDENADHRKLTPKNGLERGMFAVWDRGGRFHTTGMFLLREEIPLVGQDPYEM